MLCFYLKGYKIIAADCSTNERNGAGQTALSRREPDTYVCTCAGKSIYGPFLPTQIIECVLMFWQCPLLTWHHSSHCHSWIKWCGLHFKSLIKQACKLIGSRYTIQQFVCLSTLQGIWESTKVGQHSHQKLNQFIGQTRMGVATLSLILIFVW